MFELMTLIFNAVYNGNIKVTERDCKYLKYISQYYSTNNMFSSLKIKLKSILNPFQRRSVSICVESKAKIADSKRDKSQTKRSPPQEIEFTPKKTPTNSTPKCGFDELETTSKETVPIQTVTKILQNRNNQKWLDFVSDIESQEGVDTLLLQNSYEFRKTQSKPKSNPKFEEPMNIPQVQPQRQPDCNLYRNESIPQQKVNQESEEPLKENTLIDWLEENKPEYLVIKINNERESKGKNLGAQIKKKRLEQYERHKREEAIGKSKMLCIVCEEDASREAIRLACMHRIHFICANLIKWKPRNKCTLCERKSVRDFGISPNKAKEARRISLGKRLENQKKT